MSHTPSLDIAPAAESKVESLVQHCIYLIATGKWREGMRLPSIRDAEEAWGVNRLTVQRAYRVLQDRGLISVRPRSGWYVGDHGAVNPVSKRRHDLDRLYRRFAAIIREEVNLSVLGAFRYLERLAAIRAAEQPECIFIECTALQAASHAREVSERFNLPVLPMILGDFLSGAGGVPESARVVLTSLFHVPEVAPVAQALGLTARGVTIEVASGMRNMLAGQRGVILLESEEEMARSIADDISYLIGGAAVGIRIVDDVQHALIAELEDPYTAADGPAFLLSPRHWGNLPPRLQEDPRVRPVRFMLTETAWPGIAEALGLPLGPAA